MMKTSELFLRTEAQLIHSDKPSSRILEVTISAPEASGKRDAAPLNLALVIDRSGSMSDGKLEQVKAAVQQILDLLRPVDSAAIVDFDHLVTVTAESASITPAARNEMKARVNSLHPRGSTDLGGGWLQGCECAAKRLAPGRISRALLLTDGQANQGITSPDALRNHASALFERGIATSTFGVGLYFNEHLLEAMANSGGGNYYYIDHTNRIPEILLKEFNTLASATLKNVTLELTFPVGVAIELFGEWRCEKVENRLIVNLSDMPAGRTFSLFVNLLTPPGSGELKIHADLKGLNEEDQPFHFEEQMWLRYASAGEVAQAEENSDKAMTSRFAQVVVGQRSNEAYKLERAGKRQEAGELLDAVYLQYADELSAPLRDRFNVIRREVRQGLQESQRKTYNRASYRLKRAISDEEIFEADKEE